jgi:putative addiction module component (TIGR02574 family)
MAASPENIESQVLKLPRRKRAQIALQLLNSLEQEQSSVSRDAIEKAWVDESLRRLEAYRRGQMGSYPAEEVIAELERCGSIARIALKLTPNFDVELGAK